MQKGVCQHHYSTDNIMKKSSDLLEIPSLNHYLLMSFYVLLTCSLVISLSDTFRVKGLRMRENTAGEILEAFHSMVLRSFAV